MSVDAPGWLSVDLVVYPRQGITGQLFGRKT